MRTPKANSHKRKTNWPRVLRGAGGAFLLTGLLLTAFWCYLVWGTALTEHSNQASLAKALNGEFARPPASPTTSLPPVEAGSHSSAAFRWPALANGAAVARIRIPRIGLDQVVVQGTSTDDLMEGPGHYPGTPLPGEAGNVAIAGHRTTYAHPFYDLNELSRGDVIILSIPGHTWRYVTTDVLVVSPYDVAVAGPLRDPGGWLTLTTCNPPYSAATRLVVRARLLGQASAVPAPGTDPPSGASSTGGRTSDPPPSPRGGSWWSVTVWAIVVSLALTAGVFVWRFAWRHWRWIGLGIVACGGLLALWELFGAVALQLPAGY